MLERFVFRWAKALPSSNAVGPLSESLFTPHDTGCSAFCSEESCHASAHLHVLHVLIIRGLQHCVRVGEVDPLAVVP